MKTIAILGASGYIGKNLLARLAGLTEYRIKILSRRTDAFPDGYPQGSVELYVGDLCDPESLTGFLEPGCIVVNLIYSWGGGRDQNLAMTSNLINLCRTARVKKLIHCSTAAVVGRVDSDEVTENTPSHPVTDYGLTKLKIEQLLFTELQNVCEVIVLRPTAVFGVGAAPLQKLSSDLVAGSRLRNYLKACLFARRRMNLVHIDNVLAAISFVAEYEGKLGGEIFIVSDDDVEANNFSYVENFLIKKLNIQPYPLPPISLPLGFLAFLLRCVGRNNVNPRCNYSSGKLLGLGFVRPKNFESGLADYADSLGSSNHSSK